MLDIDEIRQDLARRLSASRYEHCLRVMETAQKLAERWGADVEKCRIAGLTHDCAKIKDHEEIMRLCREHGVNLTDDDLMAPKVIHAVLGGTLAKALYGIEDSEILQAIRYHTTGEKDMTLIDKIIFLADFIEPGRRGSKTADVRSEAYENIDKAMQKAYDYSIKKIIKNDGILHTATVRGRNHIVMNLKKREANE